jgi:hypothetical protein
MSSRIKSAPQAGSGKRKAWLSEDGAVQRFSGKNLRQTKTEADVGLRPRFVYFVGKIWN